MLTLLQESAAMAIVNVFETGAVQGGYGIVTVLPGDTGHLTFGRSQTTLVSQGRAGLLGTLLGEYCNQADARFANLLAPFLPAVTKPDLTLDTNQRFQNILRASADDPVMRAVQDQFFEQRFWAPAVASATAIGLTLPLSVATVYDSTVHGSWEMVRDMTNVGLGGDPSTIGEKAWIQGYITTRRSWLATNKNALLHATVYRMDALQNLLNLGLWDLAMPFLVRNQEINQASLQGTPPGCYIGPAPGSRDLAVQTPLQRGLDVRLLQLALSLDGCSVVADGIFGQGSLQALMQFRSQKGLAAEPGAGADAAMVAQLAAGVTNTST